MKTITTTCPICKGTKDIDVDDSAYLDWQRGVLIQKAFPRMSADDRERLVSGMCPPCWDRMFGEDEDEDDLTKLRPWGR